MKKGFTLIELLAVIVILAIIALIATPILLGIIEKTKKGSFEESINLITSGIEIDVINKSSDEVVYTLEDNKLMNNGEQINYKGKIDGQGYIKVKNKKQYEIEIENDKYCFLKSYEMSQGIVTDGKCEQKNLLIVDNNLSFPYNIGGINIDYDKKRQIFTVDGTRIISDITTFFLGYIPLSFKENDRYTISIIPLNNPENTGHMNLNFELINNSKVNVSPRHYTAADVISETNGKVTNNYSRTILITSDDALEAKYAKIYFWLNNSNLPTIDNYKFKVMINKGNKIDWRPSLTA